MCQLILSVLFHKVHYGIMIFYNRQTLCLLEFFLYIYITIYTILFQFWNTDIKFILEKYVSETLQISYLLIAEGIGWTPSTCRWPSRKWYLCQWGLLVGVWFLQRSIQSDKNLLAITYYSWLFSLREKIFWIIHNYSSLKLLIIRISYRDMFFQTKNSYYTIQADNRNS